MKALYLVRHAKSSWADPFQDDFDRPLNQRGMTDAPRMGKRLQKRDLHPDALVSSPAQRALSTCTIIAEDIDFPPQRIQTDRRLYHASDEQILRVIHELDDNHNEVMLFGHNPGLTDFSNRTARNLRLDNLPTCGIVALRFQIDSWKDVKWASGDVVFVDYPKLGVD